MNYPRSFFTILFLLSSILTFAIIFSCNPEKCKGVNCLNGGACIDNKCICPTGYTGTYCEMPPLVDPCSTVTCRNGGTCDSGICTCPIGTTGRYCETIFREQYNGSYKGNVTENGLSVYNDWTLNFALSGNDLDKMTLTIKDSIGGVTLPTFQITLTSFSTTGTAFTITPRIVFGTTYVGSGIVNKKVASFTLEQFYGGPTSIRVFSAMYKIL